MKIITTENAPVASPLAQAVTKHCAFGMASPNDLFAVQAGVPLTDALDALSLLIGCANSAISDAEEDAPKPWHAAHMLDICHALTEAIRGGLMQAQRAGEAMPTEGRAEA